MFNYRNVSAKFDAVYKHMMTLQQNEKLILKRGLLIQLHPTMCSMADFMKWKLTESGLDKFNPYYWIQIIITQSMCLSSKIF